MTLDSMNLFSGQLHDLLLKKVSDKQINATEEDVIRHLQLMIVPVKEEMRWVIFNKKISDQLTDDIIAEIEALWTEAQQ